jgi:polyvinyl alcohol dehydrogenase (cytochrome)
MAVQTSCVKIAGVSQVMPFPSYLFAVLALSVFVSTPASAQAVDGAAVFTRNCATCHDGGGDSRAPTRDQLESRTPESIINALTGGAMRYQGLSLSGAERRAVAEFLSDVPMGTAAAMNPKAGRCANPRPMADPASSPLWNGWGPTLANTHFQPARAAGLAAADVPKLTLAWAFAFPEVTASWGQPTIAGGRLFVGSQSGVVYALDANSGCVLWTYEAEGGVRASISIGRRPGGAATAYNAYFSDQKGYAYALDAGDGRVIWKKVVDDHPLVRLTGSPALYQDRLYVPTSSYEEVGKGPTYACCTFRGAIVAMDAKTGDIKWRAYPIADPPVVMGKNAQGIDSIGPSGGAIWSAPTIDPKRRAIYVGVGNTYSGKTQPATDAVAAFDLDTGKLRWAQQGFREDVFGCRNNEPNCGATQGPDYDFGVSPALARLPDGREILVAGQKSGVAFAFDPDNGGKILWEYRAGQGGALGGIEWGVAVDDQHAYVPVADPNRDTPGGLHAVNLTTGARAWFAPPPDPLFCGRRGRGCSGAQSAAVTAIPGVVFSGAFDGGIRAYSTKDGAVIWSFDTNKEFLTVNGIPGRGGSLNGPAPVVADGMLYVPSGDYRARPGNVLLAFAVQ